MRIAITDIARKYLGIPDLYRQGYGNTVNLTDKQVEKALREMYKTGEHIGYKQGFHDAKQACECDLHDIVDTSVRISTVDIPKNLV